jgi:lysozyme
MTTSFLEKDLIAFEGWKNKAYPDPLTKQPWTIGVGMTGPNITEGTVWTDAQIQAELDDRIGKCKAQLDRVATWWRQLSDERQDVLVIMAWQLGITGLLHFTNMLKAAQAGDWHGAAANMLASQWATQTPARAKKLAAQMLTGHRGD